VTLLPSIRARRKFAVLSGVFALLAACTDGNPVTSTGPAPLAPVEGALQAISCTASRTGTVSCGAVDPTTGEISAAVFGGQGVNIKLTSSNVAYTEEDSIFRFDVTVQNLLEERLGTADGVSPHADGIRVFFAAQPAVTSGTGEVSVVDADSQTTFTAANQPYIQYDAVLAKNEVSAPRTWRLKVDPTVGTFSFTLYVAARLQPLLVITELMANPGGVVQDTVGEYVEVYNAGRFPVDMNGMTISDNGASHTISGEVVVPSLGYVLLGRSTNTAINGGITPDYLYVTDSRSTALQFSNSGNEFFRIRMGGVTVDSAGYTNSSTAAAAGVSRELKNPALDNKSIDGTNWAAATTNYHASNKGTPGQSNGTGTPLPTAGPPATVTVNPGSFALAPGGTRQLSATARDSINQVTTTTFTWTSLNASVASVNTTGLVTAVANGTASIVVVASNGKADTSLVTVEAPAGLSYLNHLEFGTPTDGTPDNELILTKPQFALSYSETRGGPNWVSWNLNATQFGGAERCNCFLADTQLPDSMYRVVTSDYTGSGYSRGHMVMSEQRTASDAENAVTFLLTNILPQIQDMNGGPWLQFEIHNNDQARISNKEVYVIAGGLYSANPATLNGAGKVQIPTHTWKIAVIVDRGKGLNDIFTTADLQVIAVNMPNIAGIQSQPWTAYQTTVNAIEAATGYDFLSSLPDAIENVVEANQ
jgi:DNA/RNA endonuclease G (NUC1)